MNANKDRREKMQLRLNRQKALAGDTQVSEIGLGNVLEDIQEWINYSDDFGYNPVAHLEQYFPAFCWRHVNLKSDDLAYLKKVIEENDYIFALWESYSNLLVARHKTNYVPRKICWQWREYQLDKPVSNITWPEVVREVGEILTIDRDSEGWVKTL